MICCIFPQVTETYSMGKVGRSVASQVGYACDRTLDVISLRSMEFVMFAYVCIDPIFTCEHGIGSSLMLKNVELNIFLQMTSLVISPNISKLLVSHWSQSKFSYAIHLRSWQPSSWLDLPCRWCQYTWCAIARQEDTRSYHSQEWFGSWGWKSREGRA